MTVGRTPRAAEAGHTSLHRDRRVLATIGTAEGGPVPPLNLIGDFGGGGMLLIAGLLAALVERGTSGRGRWWMLRWRRARRCSPR